MRNSERPARKWGQRTT